MQDFASAGGNCVCSILVDDEVVIAVVVEAYPRESWRKRKLRSQDRHCYSYRSCCNVPLHIVSYVRSPCWLLPRLYIVNGFVSFLFCSDASLLVYGILGAFFPCSLSLLSHHTRSTCIVEFGLYILSFHICPFMSSCI